MQAKSTARAHMQRTQTPGIYKHGIRYVVVWNEDGKKVRRSFPTYEAACAFRRDYVLPYRERAALPPSRIEPPRRGGGWVYAAQSQGPGEPVKVGWSSDPANRLRALATAHPHGLDVVLLLPGSKHLEQQIHERLAIYRLQGEWFSREALTDLCGIFAASVMPA